MQPIIIASPHPRNDSMETRLRELLPGRRVVRIVERAALNPDKIDSIKPSYIFFPHWSWRIPSQIHTQYECVVFHMTDLPYGRGGSPLQNLIVRGHDETMLTALQCVEDLDAGPIYLKRPLSLGGTAEEILQRASDLMTDMAKQIITESPCPVVQEGSVVKFQRRRPEDSDISSLEPLTKVYDYIRMLDGEGYPPAFIDTPTLHLEFKEASLNGDSVVAKVLIRRKQDA